MGKLTDKERKIVDAEYEKHKHDNICPHTTNPLQVKQLCKRCVMLDRLNINVYQMPQGDWGASSRGYISDGFETRHDAEEWAIKKQGGKIDGRYSNHCKQRGTGTN